MTQNPQARKEKHEMLNLIKNQTNTNCVWQETSRPHLLIRLGNMQWTEKYQRTVLRDRKSYVMNSSWGWEVYVTVLPSNKGCLTHSNSPGGMVRKRQRDTERSQTPPSAGNPSSNNDLHSIFMTCLPLTESYLLGWSSQHIGPSQRTKQEKNSAHNTKSFPLTSKKNLDRIKVSQKKGDTSVINMKRYLILLIKIQTGTVLISAFWPPDI